MAEDLVASGAVESVDGYRLTHEGVKWPGAVEPTSTIFRYPSSEGDVFTLSQERGEYQIQYGAIGADGSIIWRPDGYQVPARPYSKTFTMPAGTAYVVVSWQHSAKSEAPTLVKVSGGGSMSVLSSAQVTLAWSAGILATVRYYQLAAPTAATPTVPTSSSNLGSWSETEPEADVTKVLWVCERTVYADGTESWSKASKSTSYEAAKDAKGTANAAKGAADRANSKADNLSTLIHEGDDGITVGKSADGKTYATGRTRMTADAFQVLDKAGTVITQMAKDGASFLAGLVRIVVGTGTLPGNKTTEFISVDAGSGVAGLSGVISRLDAAIDGITSSVSAGWEQDFGHGVTAIVREGSAVASSAYLAKDKAELHVGDNHVTVTPTGFEMSDPAAMLSALGLGAAETYQAATTDPTLTYDSTTVLRWGRVCVMPFAVHYTSDWAPSEYAIFTLPEAVRPSVEQRGTVTSCPYNWTSDYRPTLVSIGTDGKVRLSGHAAGHWLGQLVWVV